MCNIEDKKYEFSFLEEDVLDRYGLNSEKAFGALHEEMKTMFCDQNAPKKQAV